MVHLAALRLGLRRDVRFTLTRRSLPSGRYTCKETYFGIQLPDITKEQSNTIVILHIMQENEFDLHQFQLPRPHTVGSEERRDGPLIMLVHGL